MHRFPPVIFLVTVQPVAMDVFQQVRQEEVKKWLEGIFDTDLGSDEDSLYENLRDGVMLCRLAARLDPTLNFSYNKVPKITAACHENIQIFLNLCRTWKTNTIFNSDDLYDRKNLPQVISCISDVGTIFTKQGFSPALVVSPAHLFVKKSKDISVCEPEAAASQEECKKEKVEDCEPQADATQSTQAPSASPQSSSLSDAFVKSSSWIAGPTRSNINRTQRRIMGSSRIGGSFDSIEGVSPPTTPEESRVKEEKQEASAPIEEEEDEEEDVSDDTYDVSCDSEDDFDTRETDRLAALYKELSFGEFDSFDEEFDVPIPVKRRSVEKPRKSPRKPPRRSPRKFLEEPKQKRVKKKPEATKTEESEVAAVGETCEEDTNKEELQTEETNTDENNSQIHTEQAEKEQEPTEEKIETETPESSPMLDEPEADIEKEIDLDLEKEFEAEEASTMAFDEYESVGSGETVSMEKYQALLEQFRILQQQFILQSEELAETKSKLMEKSQKLKRDKQSGSAIKGLIEKKSLQRKKEKTSLEEEERLAEEEKEQHKLIMELKEKRRKEREESRRAHLTDKRQLQRMSVLQEILNTEKSYLYNLQILIRSKYALHKGKAISEQESTYIFSNIEDLYSIHQDISKSLDTRFLTSNDEDCWRMCIGDIFIKLSESLNKYTAYVDNQAQQNQCVGTCGQRKNFVNALCRGVTEFDTKDLVVVQFNSYLITPVQRMCKYPLLLRELIRFTDDDHEDKPVLEDALAQIQAATMQVNERKKEFESYVKMLELQNNLEHLPRSFQLITPSRVFIREAVMDKISKGKTQERHFFLFSDLILYASKSVLKSSKMQMKGKIPLDRLLVRDIMDNESLKNAFELVRMDHKKKKYIICAATPTEKNLWVQDIGDRVLYYLEVEKRKSQAAEMSKSKVSTEPQAAFSDKAIDNNDDQESVEEVIKEEVEDESKETEGRNQTGSIDLTSAINEQMQVVQKITKQISLLKDQTETLPEGEREAHEATIQALEEELTSIAGAIKSL